MADANATPAGEQQQPPAKSTGPRRLTGIVTRDKNLKTRRVDVNTRVQHPKYGKFIKKRTICYAHDENNESHLGDLVEIVESRPLSALKRWRLVRVVTKAPSRALAQIEGAVAGAQAPDTTGQQAQG
jgi:small subunit ribosomal protein S17